jgi:pimeloyl-ACP methyl ester carboxylesterase
VDRPKTRYAKANDINIAYQVVGDGPVDILYAQGWLTNIEYAWESPDYARFLKKLGSFSRLIFFDKRGTGMSDRDVGVATLEQRTEDITAVLDAVGSKKVALYGSSEGGNMTTLFAATYPERVSHLVLFGSRARKAWAPDWSRGTKREEIEVFIKDLLENWGEPFELDTGAPSVADDPAVREWMAAYWRFSASPRAAEQITRLNYEIDIRGILPAIRVPTLVLNREGDQWCGVEEARYIAEHVPGAVLKILPGDDHMQWFGDQDSLIAEVREFVTGTQSAREEERALLTVAMTDIVGSTEALASMGDDRWRAVLEQLDGQVARRVSSHGGQRVKHTGDGYLLAFTGPSRAIDCAQSIKRDAAKLGLELRTGLHTGECVRRGGDLSGLAVHIAARVMETSAPSEILTSRTVRDLVAGSGHNFVAAGPKTFKGVPGEWEVFSVSS